MLDNSSNQHPLPGDLQSRVENALNLVTSLEAEHARLTKLSGVETQRINALHEEKNYLKGQIVSLNSELENLKEDARVSKAVLAELDGQKTLINNELADATSKLSIARTELESKKLDIERKENELKSYEDSINTRAKSLEESEKNHSLKVEKLKKAIE